MENTAYWLKETSAPEGYLLDDSTGCYFYFANSGATLNAPNDFTSSSVYNPINLRSTGNTIEIENEPIPTTSLEVKKKWLDSDGNDLTNSREGEISFQIWRAQVVKDNSTEDNPTEDDNNTYDLQITIGQYNPVPGGQNYDGFYNETFSSVASGSILTFEIITSAWSTPTVKLCQVDYWNGEQEEISPISTEAQNNGSKKYSYSYTIKNGWKIQGITSGNDGTVQNVVITPPQISTDPEEPEKTELTWSQYGTETYTLSSTDVIDGTPWKKSIKNLPVYDLDENSNAITINEEGKKAHYIYTVREVSSGSYTTVYDESEVEKGKVTITNTLSDSFELPETGGIGTYRFIILGEGLVLFSTLTLAYKIFKDN